MTFFEELLKRQTIVVPGVFFDINQRRQPSQSPCIHFVRLSFGPPMEELKRGLDGIQRLVDEAHQLYEEDGHLMNGMGFGYAQSHSKTRSHAAHEAPSSGS